MSTLNLTSQELLVIAGSSLLAAAAAATALFVFIRYPNLPPTPTSSAMKNIVILGGSYGGVSTAHRILKNGPKGVAFKITLVAPNTDLYWNMASPRGIIPGQLTDEQLFQPIAKGFSTYAADRFEFILGSAETLDVEARTVVVGGSSGKITVKYDYLIVATGSRTKERVPFKTLSSTEETKELLHTSQEKVKGAKRIVIAGAGVTGVEAAGELGYQYGQNKEIILLSSDSTILAEAPASVATLATKALQSLHVKTKLQIKVLSSTQTPDGRQDLQLSSGETLIADMYIPTFGLIPNSSFVPAQFRDTNGYVTVNNHLNIKGVPNVWALGDVSDMEYSQVLSCDRQSTYVAKSIASRLVGKAAAPYKPMTSRMMGLQIGKKAGAGHFGNWKIPSFLIVYMRKNLFVERLGPLVDGSLY